MDSPLDSIPRWQGGYHQEGWSGSPVLPIFELSVAFAVIVYVWETYLDIRQHARTRTSGHVVPGELKVLVKAIDQEALKATKQGAGDSASSPADADGTGSVEGKDATQSSVADGKMLDTLKEKAPKTRAYNLDKSSFGLVKGAWNQLQELSFLLLGAIPWMWDMATSLVQQAGFDPASNEILVSLVFMGLQLVGDTVLSVPWSLYSTFVVEAKHGFNRTTIGTFVADTVKSLLLSVVLGAPILAALITIIQWGGPYFYLYVWGFMFAVMVVLLTIYPVYIQPLFYTFTPLENGELKDRIYALADKCKFPLTKLFVMDGSKRSAHSNAYFYGFFKNKRIVLFDTLIKQMTVPELEAVLGHEIGHWHHGHVIQGFVITQAYMLATFMAYGYFMHEPMLYAAFGFSSKPTLIGLMLFIQTVWAPVDKVLNFLLTINSRRNEFQADRFSLGLGYGPLLQSGLVKMSIENLSGLDPDPIYSAYHYSHPPLIQRLRAISSGLKKAA